MANSGVTQLLGFRFRPTDREIIGSFLYKMVGEKRPLTSMPQYNKVIHKCNLFGNKREPSEIWRDYGGDQLKEGSRLVLRFGAPEKRFVHPTQDWPRKRKFRYENENTSEDHAVWLLDEYSLFKKACKNGTSSNCYDFDVVICRLRRKGNMDNSWKKRKCSSQDQSNKKMKRDQSTKKMKRDQSTKEMKTENSVGPQIVNDERNQLMINESTTYDQEYLIDTNYKRFDIDEIFAELDCEPPLLDSQQLPEIAEGQEEPCVNQIEGPVEAATSNPSHFEYNSDELAELIGQHNMNAYDHEDPNLFFEVDELLAEDAEPLSSFAELDDVYNVVSQPLDQNSYWSNSFMDQTYNSFMEEIMAD
ncbi:NAC transcription factor 29-like [Prunus yedoensis var. nudiflora]|uniref:NAC transcription factor 29-like n=1 Tax=Prunus yedoensis var. nudiflora TaxID=2094558 RepID=A0A314Z9Q5_PRUYE|nr:NAC transcription factor 29-like [Prunus yedoensis var. nudiflora]